MNNTAQTAIDNASALLAIVHAAVDTMHRDDKLADGIALTLDHLAAELETAQQALG